MWAILSAPLLVSIDLRNVNAESKALLQNNLLISVNQDPLGLQGHRIMKVREKRQLMMSVLGI